MIKLMHMLCAFLWRCDAKSLVLQASRGITPKAESCSPTAARRPKLYFQHKQSVSTSRCMIGQHVLLKKEERRPIKTGSSHPVTYAAPHPHRSRREYNSAGTHQLSHYTVDGSYDPRVAAAGHTSWGRCEHHCPGHCQHRPWPELE
jgi:hypothetical protein